MSMKTKTRISLITLCLILFSISNCKNYENKKNAETKESFSEEQISRMLKSFYTSYINANAELNNKKSDSIQNKYCTQNLLNSIRKKFAENSLDYDPFLHSQMIDITMLENMNIQKDSLKNDIYYFSYFRPYYKKYVTIKLGILKEKNCYKIDQIFLEYQR